MDVNHMVSLETKHAQLDQRIRQEILRPQPDQSLLSRLKKQKLKIKEELALS
ncbi:MAG: YdcH family protein [Chakrabartia sp.]